MRSQALRLAHERTSGYEYMFEASCMPHYESG